MIKRTICIENPCHLKCRNDQLVVNYEHIKGYESLPEKTVPIEDLGIVVLEHPQITISHFLLDKLVANNTAIITCNETRHPTGMFLCLEGNTIQSERFREQALAKEPLKKQLWQQTISAKLRNQAAVLEKWKINHEYLKNLSQIVKSGDAGNNEAKGSLYYWSHLFPPEWNFTRKREGLPPNNLLNYGYAIIRATMARALTGAGLIPTYGIFHRNRYNAYCLADDIMEPYRPFVDQTVREIIYNTSAVHELNAHLKTTLLKIPALDVILNGDTSPLMVAMQRTATSVAKCFSGEQRKILYPQFP